MKTVLEERSGTIVQLPVPTETEGCKKFLPRVLPRLQSSVARRVVSCHVEAWRGVAWRGGLCLDMARRCGARCGRSWRGGAMRSLTFLQVPAQAYPGRQLMPDMGVLLGEGGVRMLQLKYFHQAEKLKMCSNDVILNV